jgi:hypothetical protein
LFLGEDISGFVAVGVPSEEPFLLVANVNNEGNGRDNSVGEENKCLVVDEPPRAIIVFVEEVGDDKLEDGGVEELHNG